MFCLHLGVSPRPFHLRYERLFRALEELFAVRFTPRKCGREEAADLHGWIELAASPSQLQAGPTGLPVLMFVAGSETSCSSMSGYVQFSDSALLPGFLRQTALVERAGIPARAALVPLANDLVLASRGGQPVWVHRPATESAGPIDFVPFLPPLLPEGDFLINHFGRRCFLPLLPLLHFLQRVTRETAWSRSPQHACVIFDDANLRHNSYGCLDYRALAEHARRWNYHAAIGLIPLDFGSVSPRTAELFRECSPQLSVVIHGNDHTPLELARSRSENERVKLLALALRRIERFSRRHSVAVCAVEEPPYGIIKADFSAELVALGYEAVLVTPRQFLSCNPELRPGPAFALEAATSLPGGLGMIPRVTIAAGWETEVALRAFLGQPIVIAGHHADADDGLALMQQVAETVNRIGPITWSNLSCIARANYVSRRRDGTLAVRLAGRRVHVPVPADVRQLIVERPWIVNGDRECLRQECLGATTSVLAGSTVTLPVARRGLVELHSPAPRTLDPHAVPGPHFAAGPALRRILTEARDRAYPYLPRPFQQSRLARAVSSE